MVSLFVYKMLVSTLLSPEQLMHANKLIRDFIWKGKRPWISMLTLKKKKNQGGLRLVNLIAKQESLLISWVFKLNMDPFLCYSAYNNLCPIVKERIWQCNLNVKDVVKWFNTEEFWPQVLRAWSKINYRDPQSKLEIREQLLWWNSSILIQNKPVIWQVL